MLPRARGQRRWDLLISRFDAPVCYVYIAYIEVLMPTVTTRLDNETQAKLEALAKATDRSRSWLVADAIRRYVEEESWQVAAIEEGVRQADAGDFASDEEVKQAFAKLDVNAG
ncbi:transcriptional regulator, CopG family [Desulfocurvibacter africanus subsp. africanus str. Walvis Bay]|uniref:Transcriptional regulator, CopG family n=2 Tax=Desulfocurvibacter africanus TaxID=873 RepID=F3YXH4_DESAF|nr:transcriptional regulator, CopG family [Desulfocurvibacter africanus subsp. africanus str. Walvis Bay]